MTGYLDREIAPRVHEAILGEPGPVTIDEAQRMPGIMEIIKAQVDRDGQVPGRFLLSGSANFALLKGVSESLAGRAIYIEMSPFSRREILRTTTKEPFLRTFFRKPSLPREIILPKAISG